MIRCRYRRGTRCLIGRYDKATNGRCVSCQRMATDRITGLGDVVALTINLTPAWRLKPLLSRGKKGCGCGARQKRLNSAMPIRRAEQRVHIRRSEGQVWTDGKSCGCK